jgi:hypothetical protein
VARYKVEFEYENAAVGIGAPEMLRRDALNYAGTLPDTVKVEKLPDPPIVKKFEVEIEFPADHPPARHMDYARAIRLSIVDPAAGPVTTSPDRTVTVKEIS